MLIPDLQRIQHIKRYCEEIMDTVSRFGAGFNAFANDKDYFKSVSMSLMQIGELSKGLSDDLKESSKTTVPWRELKGMRNMYAHTYETMSKRRIWETATENVPDILQFCNKTLAQNHVKTSPEPERKPSTLKRMEELKKVVAEQDNKPKNPDKLLKPNRDPEL